MEEQTKETIFYKIMAGKKVRVWKNTYNEKDYYRIQVTQKQYDGQTDKFYKPVTFKRNVDIPNQSDIIIEEGYENLRANPKDPYNPISTIMITKFTLCESQEQKTANALDEFRDNLYNIESEHDEFDVGF